MKATRHQNVVRAALSTIADATVGPHGIVALVAQVAQAAKEFHADPRYLLTHVRLFYVAEDDAVPVPRGIETATARQIREGASPADLAVTRWVDAMLKQGTLRRGGRLVGKWEWEPGATQ